MPPNNFSTWLKPLVNITSSSSANITTEQPITFSQAQSRVPSTFLTTVEYISTTFISEITNATNLTDVYRNITVLEQHKDVCTSPGKVIQ